MLTRLIIKNLLLFEEISISFQEGFTAITGESGSGKTAVIEAIRLILGERADLSKIRKQTEVSHIEAHFEGPFSQLLLDSLEEASIESSLGEPLSIRREIHLSGKTKAYVNHHLVTSSFLQILAPHLVDFVGQHHALLLKQGGYQRKCLDLFGNIDPSFFGLLFAEEKEKTKCLEKMKLELAQERVKRERFEFELSEIQQAQVKEEGEESTLAQLHKSLATSQELCGCVEQIFTQAEEIQSGFSRLLFLVEKIGKQEESLAPISSLLKESKVLFSEALYEIEKKGQSWEVNPIEIEALEKRLHTLHLLRKKYGKDPFLHLAFLEKELSSLSSLEEEVPALEKQISKLHQDLEKEALHLRRERQAASSFLAHQLTSILQTLNMSHAQVTVNCTQEARSSYGEDGIEFLLQANPGEKPATAREGCSGGELSRLLFALKCLLAEKIPTSSMVFDEIDANIGGETASFMGQKLAALGRERQVLCITHFPQVAVWADHHLRVYKEEDLGRTRAHIHPLIGHERDEEKVRMLGGTTLSSPL